MYKGGEAYSLSSLLNAYKNAFCSDPRDKIYGSLSMATDHVGTIIPVDLQEIPPWGLQRCVEILQFISQP